MADKYTICLDIGGTKILGAVFDEDRKIVHRLKIRTKKEGDTTGHIETAIIRVVDQIMEESGIPKKKFHAIGATAPGVIDQEAGVVLFAPNLPFRNYDIRTPIEKKFGIPFYVGNDVNMGVYGEYRYGVAKGYHNVVGFFVGTGMGGGLVLNDALFTGNQFKAAEYGHMVLDPEGPLCGCGQRGCLEAFSSKTGMTSYIRQQVSRGRKSFLSDYVKEGTFRSRYLKKALKEKDTVTLEAVDRACHYLAIATGNMINTISPDIVVYGGGVIEAVGEVFMEKILSEVDRYTMPSIRNTVELAQAALGDDSVIYGLLAMIEDADRKKK